MVDYLKRLFDRLDAKYETFRDDFEAEYFLQKNALAMIRLRRDSGKSYYFLNFIPKLHERFRQSVLIYPIGLQSLRYYLLL